MNIAAHLAAERRGGGGLRPVGGAGVERTVSSLLARRESAVPVTNEQLADGCTSRVALQSRVQACGTRAKACLCLLMV